MKYIVAIIQPSKLETVLDALKEVDVFRITVSDVLGCGQQRGLSAGAAEESSYRLVKKSKLEIAANDAFVQPTIDAIVRAGRTGEEGRIGDGKIFVMPLEEVVRIRTGETGGTAI